MGGVASGRLWSRGIHSHPRPAHTIPAPSRGQLVSAWRRYSRRPDSPLWPWTDAHGKRREGLESPQTWEIPHARSCGLFVADSPRSCQQPPLGGQECRSGWSMLKPSFFLEPAAGEFLAVKSFVWGAGLVQNCLIREEEKPKKIVFVAGLSWCEVDWTRTARLALCGR